MIRSVARAVELLQAVARAGDWVGVRELARATGLNPSTAQNLLKTLQETGLLEFDEGSRRYRLGLAAIRLAEGVEPLARLAALARGAVDRLHGLFNETAAALALLDDRVTVVDWRQAEQALAVTHREAIIAAPQQLASGRVVLAWQPAETRQRLLAGLTYEPGPGLPADAVELEGWLAAIRRAGLAETWDVAGSGIAAVAAPVFDAAGRLVLALGCSLPLVRVTPATRARLREETVKVAGELTAGLGGRPPREI